MDCCVAPNEAGNSMSITHTEYPTGELRLLHEAGLTIPDAFCGGLCMFDMGYCQRIAKA